MEVDFWSYIIQNINVCIFATCIKEASLARNPCGMFCFSLLFFSVLIHFISQLIRESKQAFLTFIYKKTAWSDLSPSWRMNKHKLKSPQPLPKLECFSLLDFIPLRSPETHTHPVWRVTADDSVLLQSGSVTFTIQTQAHMILFIIYTWKHTWWAKLWLRGCTGENLQGLVPKE